VAQRSNAMSRAFALRSSAGTPAQRLRARSDCAVFVDSFLVGFFAVGTRLTETGDAALVIPVNVLRLSGVLVDFGAAVGGGYYVQLRLPMDLRTHSTPKQKKPVLLFQEIHGVSGHVLRMRRTPAVQPPAWRHLAHPRHRIPSPDFDITVISL
jgi:hypothetical protein